MEQTSQKNSKGPDEGNTSKRASGSVGSRQVYFQLHQGQGVRSEVNKGVGFSQYLHGLDENRPALESGGSLELSGNSVYKGSRSGNLIRCSANVSVDDSNSTLRGTQRTRSVMQMQTRSKTAPSGSVSEGIYGKSRIASSKVLRSNEEKHKGSFVGEDRGVVGKSHVQLTKTGGKHVGLQTTSSASVKEGGSIRSSLKSAVKRRDKGRSMSVRDDVPLQEDITMREIRRIATTHIKREFKLTTFHISEEFENSLCVCGSSDCICAGNTVNIAKLEDHAYLDHAFLDCTAVQHRYEKLLESLQQAALQSTVSLDLLQNITKHQELSSQILTLYSSGQLTRTVHEQVAACQFSFSSSFQSFSLPFTSDLVQGKRVLSNEVVRSLFKAMLVYIWFIILTETYVHLLSLDDISDIPIVQKSIDVQHTKLSTADLTRLILHWFDAIDNNPALLFDPKTCIHAIDRLQKDSQFSPPHSTFCCVSLAVELLGKQKSWDTISNMYQYHEHPFATLQKTYDKQKRIELPSLVSLWQQDETRTATNYVRQLYAALDGVYSMVTTSNFSNGNRSKLQNSHKQLQFIFYYNMLRQYVHTPKIIIPEVSYKQVEPCTFVYTRVLSLFSQLPASVVELVTQFSPLASEDSQFEECESTRVLHCSCQSPVVIDMIEQISKHQICDSQYSSDSKIFQNIHNHALIRDILTKHIQGESSACVCTANIIALLLSKHHVSALQTVLQCPELDLYIAYTAAQLDMTMIYTAAVHVISALLNHPPHEYTKLLFFDPMRIDSLMLHPCFRAAIMLEYTILPASPTISFPNSDLRHQYTFHSNDNTMSTQAVLSWPQTNDNLSIQEMLSLLPLSCKYKILTNTTIQQLSNK